MRFVIVLSTVVFGVQAAWPLNDPDIRKSKQENELLQSYGPRRPTIDELSARDEARLPSQIHYYYSALVTAKVTSDPQLDRARLRSIILAAAIAKDPNEFREKIKMIDFNPKKFLSDVSEAGTKVSNATSLLGKALPKVRGLAALGKYTLYAAGVAAILETLSPESIVELDNGKPRPQTYEDVMNVMTTLPDVKPENYAVLTAEFDQRLGLSPFGVSKQLELEGLKKGAMAARESSNMSEKTN